MTVPLNEPAAALAPLQILLVDDREDVYHLVRALLAQIRQQRFTLAWAATYADALAAIRDVRHDAYLIDLELRDPLRNGLDLMRDVADAGRTGPVIILTSHTDHALELEALAGGAAAFLDKGELSAPALARAIRYAIERTRLVGELQLAQSELLEHTTLLEVVTERAPVFITYCDAETRFRFLNTRYADHLGMPRESIVGKRMPEVIGEAAYERIRASVEASLAGRACEVKVEVANPSSGAGVMHCAFVPDVSAGGRVQGLIAVMTDVTERAHAEEQLALLAAIVASSGDAIYGRTLEGKIMSWNPGAERLYGYTAGEVEGKVIDTFVPPDRAEEFALWWERAGRGEATTPHETVRVHKNGSRVDVSLTLSPIRDATGALTGVSAIARDIGDRMRAAAALRASEERFRQLADAMPQIVWTARPDGAADYYNQRWVDFTGVTLGQTEGLGWESVLHPDDLDSTLDGWSRSVQSGADYDAKFRFKRAADGAYRWHLGRASASRDAQGHIVKWFGTCTDIDDQKRAEEALERARQDLEARVEQRTAELSTTNEALERQLLTTAQSETRLAAALEKERALFDNALDVICSIDPDGRFVSVSAACLKMWGYSKAELIGRRYIELVVPEDIPKTNKIAAAIVAGEAASDFENRYLHKNGSHVITMWTAFWSQSEQLMFSVARNMTEKKRAEDALRRETAFGEVLKTVAIVANEASTVDEAVQTCLDQVCALTKWPLGHVYLAAKNLPEQLEATVVWHVDDRERFERFIRAVEDERLIGGSELVGRAFTAGAARWTGDVARGDTPPGTGLADEVGIRARLAFPILIGTKATGVLEFFSMEREEPDEKLLELMALVGAQLGQVVERKLTEAALRASEERFQLVTRATNDAVWDWDLLTNDLWWNPGFQTLFGYRPEEIGSSIESWTKRVHPDDVDHVVHSIHEILSTGQQTWSGEYRFRRADGSYSSVNDRGYVVRDDDGTPLRMLGSMMDVTERKRAEAALQESRDYLDRIINAVADPIFVKDRQHRLVLLNDAMCALMGGDREVFLGKSDLELFPEAEAEVFWAKDELVFLTGDDNVNEEELTDSSGVTRTILTRKRRYSDTAGAHVIVGVIRDITEHKRSESELLEARDAALASTRLKSEFLANMSHEIRTPMNGIVGMTELLLDTSLTDEQHQYASTISSSGETLLVLINDILDFSKIEAGKLTFEEIDFDVHQVLASVGGLLAARAQAKGVDFVVLTEEAVPSGLRGDPGRLRQVLTNLASNAVKFTERGEVVLRVAVERSEDGRVVLRFTVQDTGIGIDSLALETLFEPFTQADGSTTRKYGGTGLGLAIAKQLVELMEGTMSVQSTLGEGSTFSFTAVFGTQEAPAEPPATWRPELEGLRVLVVNDNAAARATLVGQLALRKVVGRPVEDGPRALSVLRGAAACGEPFDLAILDLRTPEADGFELARVIHADPALAAVRLVMIPAVGLPGHGASARAAGISAYLTRPVDEPQLFECLAAVMAMREADCGSPAAALVTRHTLGGAVRIRDWPVAGVRTVVTGGATAAALPHDARILVVEDNEINQQVLLGQLAKLGCRADIAVNGLEALRALAGASYHLVLMDCQMPRMDGYAATEEIRRREGSTRHTPIVALTANAIDGDRERCLAAGMDDYLSKPVKRVELKEMLERWLTPAESTPPAAEPHNAPDQEGSAPVDVVQLLDAADDDPDMVRRLVAMYVESATEALDQLDAAVESDSAALVVQVAHRLNGGSLACGMVAIVPPLGELERRGKDGGVRDAAMIVAQARAAFERIRRFLADYLQQLPSESGPV